VADRIGPPPINTLPTGLLDLLGIKTGGEYPRDFPSVLAASLELMPLYLAAKAEQIVATPFTRNATGFSAVADLQVPSGEYWWLHDATLRAVTGAAEAVTVELGWFYNQLAPNASVFVQSAQLVLGASAQGSCMATHLPAVVPPGSAPCTVVNAVTGVIDFALFLSITRLRI